MYGEVPLAAMLTLCGVMIGYITFISTGSYLLAKKAGIICFAVFTSPFETVCGTVCAAFIISCFWDIFFLLGIVSAVICTALLFAPKFYITENGVLFVQPLNRHKPDFKFEPFTAYETDGKILICRKNGRQLCRLKDTPDIRERLAKFLREPSARKENPYRDKILAVLEKWEIDFEEFNIDFSLPFHCQRSKLNEVLIQAKLGNYLADIGWYPEADPNGKLRTLLIEDGDRQRPLAEYEDRDFDGLERHLCEISKRVEDFYS